MIHRIFVIWNKPYETQKNWGMMMSYIINSPVFVRLHHDLIGFRITLPADLTETLGDKCAVIVGVVVQLNFPSVASTLFLVLDDIFFHNFDFLGFRWAVYHRGAQMRRCSSKSPSDC